MYKPMPPSPADGAFDIYVLRAADFLRVRPDEWNATTKRVVYECFMSGYSPEGAGEKAIAECFADSGEGVK
jgi:hypothetical protein